MKASLKEQCNDVLRHLVHSGAYLFRDCKNRQENCEERWEKWQKALEKAQKMIEEITDG